MNGNTKNTARNGFRKHSLALALATGLTTAFAGGLAQAATWDVTVTNLTNGNHFTPILLTAHPHNMPIFEVGMPASLPMEHMAECGHLPPLLASAEVGPVDADTITNPALPPAGSPFLNPGLSITETLVTTQTHLTVVAMVLPSNDAFMGLSQHIPSEAGTYTYYVNAYDAGTESNDEVLMTSGNCAYTDVGMMPGAPGGDAGMNATGVVTPGTADTNTTIHVHRGVLGDQDSAGGNSDLNSSIHRWQNPVAKITVTVTP